MTVDDFILQWSGLERGGERSNAQSFLNALCDVIGVPRPDPMGRADAEDDYVFERAVFASEGSAKRIDLYKRGCFVLEAKQTAKRSKRDGDAIGDLFPGLPAAKRAKKAQGWDVLM
jgi:hypothetical protein